MKWNAIQIAEFLTIYEKYPLLWKIKKKDNNYHSKLRGEHFKRLYSELCDKGLLVDNVGEKRLRAKIKSIRDVYRQELGKINRSVNSGVGVEVYTPKLFWFKTAHFLSEVVPIPTMGSRSKLNQRIKPEEDSDCSMESACNGEELTKRILQKSHCKPTIKAKEMKVRRLSSGLPEISSRSHYSERIIQEVDETYDYFGNYVAAELRQLPQRQAILLIQEIQNCITSSKLSCLEPMVFIKTEELSNCSVSIGSNDDSYG